MYNNIENTSFFVFLQDVSSPILSLLPGLFFSITHLYYFWTLSKFNTVYAPEYNFEIISSISWHLCKDFVVLSQRSQTANIAVGFNIKRIAPKIPVCFFSQEMLI